jgi:DNA helicase-2/ATP-dependent DNA helicase PcrA
MELNFVQKSAINSCGETVIVAAGPGSGKSHTLIERIRRSVEKGADPAAIIALTFTNNAAHVLRHRLAVKGVRIGYAGTLHGYCMRLIQIHGIILGYRPHTVSIVTKQAKELLLEQIKTELRKKITAKELDEGQTPDARLIWQEYWFRLKRANMVDYDGILRDGLALLKRDSVKLLIEPDELLVDERQDSGAIDTEIFWEIPAKTRFFVGDVDQCIYGFRGARPDLFVEEAKTHGYISLSHNYRSDREICRAANRLIAHNSLRVEKTIQPISAAAGIVGCHSFDNDGAEIFGVWKLINEEVGRNWLYSEIAILARTNMIADKFRDALRGLGVPVNGAGRRLMPNDWSLTLSLIGLLLDPANDFHAEAILRARGSEESRIQELKRRVAGTDIYLSTVALLPNTRPASLADAMIILSAMVSAESFAIIRERANVLPSGPDDLSALLVDLWHPAGWEKEEHETNAVTVSTLHNAKGSEWPIVLLVGMEEDVFPSTQSIAANVRGHMETNPTMEEERRLCFVGVTRAKHQLYLTWAKKRTAFFKTTDQVPSRFLSEMGTPQLPAAPIDTTGGYEIPVEERL